MTPGESEPPELAKPEGHSDACDVAHVQRRSALLFAPQGKYFKVPGDMTASGSISFLNFLEFS